jgi:TetR/AcrR family tetracycline transcriptional repressor
VNRGLTKDVIVQAALGLLEDKGLEGLTVRAVAARLGVQAPALYWHVRDKQELLNEMATEIWRRIGAELAALPSGVPWDELLTAFATITRAALLGHRDGARLFSGTYLTDPDVLRRQEETLGRLLDQGFALPDVVRGYTLLYNFTIGFCIEEQATARDDRYDPERRAERLDPGASPLTIAAGPEAFGDPDARFTDLIAVLVETIGRMRTSRKASGP